MDDALLRRALEMHVDLDRLPKEIGDDWVQELGRSCEEQVRSGTTEAEALVNGLGKVADRIAKEPGIYQERMLQRRRSQALLVLTLVIWLVFCVSSLFVPQFIPGYRMLGMERLPLLTDLVLAVGELAALLWPVLALGSVVLAVLIVRQLTRRAPLSPRFILGVVIFDVALVVFLGCTVVGLALAIMNRGVPIGGG